MTEDQPEREHRDVPTTLAGLAAMAVSSDYKVRGKKSAPGGTGVLGYNTATGGKSFGVEGVSDSTDTGAAGVRGDSTAAGSTAATYGVHGVSEATGTLNINPAGVRGTGTGGGKNAGVLGVTESDEGRAAGVQAVATTGFANAILATAEGGNGVEATTSGGGSYGVWGRHTGTSKTDRDYGVFGQTYTEIDGVAGVKGKDDIDSAARSYGVAGETRSSAVGAAGVRGETTQSSGQTYGVEGETVSPVGDSAGVHGFADTTATGVLAESSSGIGLGVIGTATSSDSSPSSASDHAAFVEDTSSYPSAVLGLKGGFVCGDSANTFGLNFVTFYDANEEAVGTIENTTTCGVGLTSGSADYAEFLPRTDPDEKIEAADVVGVVDGEITKRTAGADQAMVITDRPIVTGNSPGPDSEARAGHETVAFVGQVPVRVRGTVEEGDLIVPSGENDGTARAIPAERFTPGDGPLVGRAWEGTDEDGVDEVIVAVGLETGEALEPALRHQRERVDELESAVEDLRRENRDLRARIADLETAVGTTAAPADD